MYINTILAFFLFSFGAFAKINVVATLPEFAWLANRLGGEEVKVISLLNGTEDPHYVDASPAFVFKASKADVLVYNGLELETGWLPKVLQMSGNSKIQPGEKGLCDASSRVEKLETIENYDRSKGDIHPGGNPHYTLSPKAMLQAAQAVSACLEKAGVKSASVNLKKLEKDLKELSKEQAKKLEKLKDKKFMVYHREFSYFFDQYGLKDVGSLEEVPGVLPSAAYLGKVALKAKKAKADLALASSVSPKSYLEKFKELSGVDYLMLQIHPSREEDYIAFMQKFVDKVIKNAK